MSVLQSIFLGIIQGLSEFLPVSSSGHLIVVRELFGISDTGGLFFDILVHLGTLLSLIVFLRKEIFKILTNLQDKLNQKLLTNILVASIPAFLAGLLLKGLVEERLRNSLLVALFFLITAIFLFVSDVFKVKKITKLSGLNYLDSLIIGSFQAVALFPGISRSGSTIFGGILKGLSRKDSVKFSFFLAIPIITGAGFFDVLKVFQDSSNLGISLPSAFSGFISAFVFGLFGIYLLKRFVERKSLKVFSFYLLVLVVVLVVRWYLIL